MHRIFVALGSFIFVISCCSPAFSHGVLEFCSRDSTLFAIASNRDTMQEARMVASKSLEARFGSACAARTSVIFSNECLAYVLSPIPGPAQNQSRRYFANTERTERDARRG